MEIAVLNYSSKVSDADVGWMVRACNTQIIKQLAPAYEREPWPVTLYNDISVLPIGSCYPIAIMDDSDYPGALGYHTDELGFIYGRVFTSPVLNNGGGVLTSSYVSVAGVLSHEVCELFCDSEINLWAKGPAIIGGDQYAVEVCDPVEADEFSISVGAIWGKRLVNVSNFVTPEWFKIKGQGLYDYLGKLKAPFSMTDGGYMVVRNSQGVETSVFGHVLPPAWRKKTKQSKLSRTFKRGSTHGK